MIKEYTADSSLSQTLCTVLNVKKGQLCKHERCQNYSTAPLGVSSHLHGKKAGEQLWKKAQADDKTRMLGTRRKTEAPPTHPR